MIERHKHRLENFDYGSNGKYFITICTYNKNCLLSNIVYNDVEYKVVPTEIGQKVIACWKNIEKLNEGVFIEAFVLMPNHLHGIIALDNDFMQIRKNDKRYAFEIDDIPERRSIQTVIRDFKSVTTRIYKKEFSGEVLWQKSFYDEIIKSDIHYENVCNYIKSNPQKWNDDEYFK